MDTFVIKTQDTSSWSKTQDGHALGESPKSKKNALLVKIQVDLELGKHDKTQVKSCTWYKTQVNPVLGTKPRSTFELGKLDKTQVNPTLGTKSKSTFNLVNLTKPKLTLHLVQNLSQP